MGNAPKETPELTYQQDGKPVPVVRDGRPVTAGELTPGAAYEIDVVTGELSELPEVCRDD
jgi:hypothetical protein